MGKVSILLPTRQRFNMFVKTVNSLFETCNHVDNFEVLIAMDLDDTDTVIEVKEFISNKSNMKLIMFERHYYRGLHNYYNGLSNKSTGTSLFLWNDDAIMRSKNWDLEVLKHHEIFCVLSPMVDTMETYWRTQGVLFPIIPKKWFELTGSWSAVPACDSWIDVTSKRLGLLVNTPSIVISHDRNDITGNNNDITYREGRQDVSQSSFHTPQPEIMEQHYQILDTYLKNLKINNDKNRNY
jgi:hypothetical protein